MQLTIRPGRLFAIVSFLLIHLPCAGQRSADMESVPNGELQVAYRNLEEGKLGNARVINPGPYGKIIEI